MDNSAVCSKEKMTVQKSVLPDELIDETDKSNFEVSKLPGKVHGLWRPIMKLGGYPE